MSASLLARQLFDALDDHLVPTRRLADENTWTGPAAQVLQDDLHFLHRRLQVLADEWLARDRHFPKP